MPSFLKYNYTIYKISKKILIVLSKDFIIIAKHYYLILKITKQINL